jgi:hypothetical protein
MEPVMTQPTDGESWKMWDTDEGSMSLSYVNRFVNIDLEIEHEGAILTGTFFCDNTTAQSFPLTPTDMMFAAVIALKAYSILT